MPAISRSRQGDDGFSTSSVLSYKVFASRQRPGMELPGMGI
jgi:hypothetical protein